MHKNRGQSEINKVGLRCSPFHRHCQSQAAVPVSPHYPDWTSSPEFIKAAASLLKRTDRLDYEETNKGLVLKGVWEGDLESAVEELRRKMGKELHYSEYIIEYSKGQTTLEPVMSIAILSPEEHMGIVMGDLNRRRGLIVSLDDARNGKLIKARVPLAELVGYSSYLRRIAQVDWLLNVEFYDYEPIPNPEGPDPNEPVSHALRA